MIRRAAIIVIWLFAAGGAGAATVEVRLRPDMSIAASAATLADVADLAGDPAAIAQLAPIPVQDLAPAPVVVDEGVIRPRLGRRAAGLTLVITGACRARQATRTWTVDEQIAAARAVLLHADDEARIGLVRSSGPLIAGDDGHGDQRLVAESLDRSAVGEVPLRIRLLAGTRELSRALLVLRVQRLAAVAVVAAPLRRGQPLTLADVEIQTRELTPATRDALRTLPEVLGRVPIRDLAPGTVLVPAALALPLDVRPGQGVTLLFRTGSVELSGAGEALAGGRLGDIIAVRRTADDRRVRGQVVAPGRVLVNF